MALNLEWKIVGYVGVRLNTSIPSGLVSIRLKINFFTNRGLTVGYPGRGIYLKVTELSTEKGLVSR